MVCIISHSCKSFQLVVEGPGKNNLYCMFVCFNGTVCGTLQNFVHLEDCIIISNVPVKKLEGRGVNRFHKINPDNVSLEN